MEPARLRRRSRALLTCLACAWLLGSALAAPAEAVVICIGPCPDFSPPHPGTVTVPPIQLPVFGEFGAVTLQAPEGEDFTMVVEGNLRIIAPDRQVVAGNVDLRAGGDLVLGSDLQFDVAGTLALCGDDPACDPTALDTPVPGSLSVRLAATGGTLRFGAGGNLVVVPEPASAALVAAGLVTLAARRRHVASATG